MQPGSVASWFHATSVAMEQWTAQHRVSVLKLISRMAIISQTLIMAVFPVVQNFRENASALKRKPRGRIPVV